MATETNPFADPNFGKPYTQDNPFANPDFGKPSGAIRRIADQGIKLAQGVVGVPEAAVGVADLVTGGQAGKLVESAGVRFKDAKDFMGEYLSPEQKAADAEVAKAEGFFPTVGAMVSNPSTIVGSVVESAPSMLLGGVAARGAMAALPMVAPKLAASIATAKAAPFVASQGARKAATAAPIAAGAFGEGITAAGQNAEQVRQEDPNGTLTGEQSAILAGSGLLTAGISGVAGKVANKLGIGDVQTMLARGKLGVVGEEAAQAAAKKGIIRKTAEGTLSEGVLQEFPQSYQEQVAQNIAQGKPWDEGAAKAGAQGMLAGAVMGGGGNVISHAAEGPQPTPAVESEAPAAVPLQVGNTPDPYLSFPDGTVTLNGEQEFQRRTQAQPVKPSEAMGLDPAAGPMSAAATIAVDTGVHQQHLDQQTSEADQAAYDQYIAQQDEDARQQDTADKPLTHGALAEAAMSEDDKRAVLFSNKAVADGGTRYKGTRDGDILNGAGAPFTNYLSAGRRASMEGKDWTIAKIGEKQFVARRKDANGPSAGVSTVSAGADQGGVAESAVAPINAKKNQTGLESARQTVPHGQQTVQPERDTQAVQPLQPDPTPRPEVGHVQSSAGKRVSTFDKFQTSSANDTSVTTNVQDPAPATNEPTGAEATPDAQAQAVGANTDAAEPAPGTGTAKVEANGVAPKQGPGAPLANGFFAGPVEGEKFRVSDVSATGGLTLDKRLSGGTVSTMYVGADGGFVDAENVNMIGDGVARLWKPLTDLARQAAREILQEMGALPLGNKRREELKAKLKEVVANDGKPPAIKAPSTTADSDSGNEVSQSAQPGLPGEGAGVSQPTQAAPTQAVDSPAASTGDVPGARSTPVEGAGVAHKSLLKARSTKLISDDGRGRKLYSVNVTPEFRNKHFINGRLPMEDGLELRRKEDVTGNSQDEGYVLVDNREQLAARRLLDAPKAKAENASNTGAASLEGAKFSLETYGWDASKLADNYDMAQLNQLYQEVQAQFSNKLVGGSPVTKDGMATKSMLDDEGTQLHKVLQKAIQTVYSRKKDAVQPTPAKKPNAIQAAKEKRDQLLQQEQASVKTPEAQQVQAPAEAGANASIPEPAAGAGVAGPTEAVEKRTVEGVARAIQLKALVKELESNGQNDELDAEMQSYEAKKNPTYSGEPARDSAGNVIQRPKLNGADRFEYPVALSKTDDPAKTVAQARVVDYMNGDIDRPTLVKALEDSGLEQGTMFAITQRLQGDGLSIGEMDRLLERREKSAKAATGDGVAATAKAPGKELNSIKRPKGGQTLRSAAYDKNPMMTFLAKHGLFHDKAKPGSLKSEFSPDKAIMVMGYGPVFKKTGKRLDELTQNAIEEGYLPNGGTESELYGLISRAVSGEKISPIYAEGVAEQLAEQSYAEHLAQQQEAAQDEDFDPSESLDDMGFVLDDSDWAGYDDLPDPIKLEVNALLAKAGELGIDSSSIEQDAHYETIDQSEQAYYESVRSKLQAAIEAGNRSSSQDAGTQGDARVQEGLTSPTREDVLAQQERAEAATKAAAKADADATNKNKADAERGEFTLTGSDRAADVGAAGGQQAMFSRSSYDSKSSVLSKNGKFKGWPKYNTWTHAEYNDVVSLLPKEYRNDSHRQEPLDPADRDARTAAALPDLKALNQFIPGAKGFTFDSLGNIVTDMRDGVTTRDLLKAADIADKHGLGVFVTGVKTGSIESLLSDGFVSEYNLGGVLTRATGSTASPRPMPQNIYGNTAYGTMMSYKPRGFAAPMFSQSAGESPATSSPSTVAEVQKAIRQLIGITGRNELGGTVATTAAEIKSTWEPLTGQSVNIESEGDAGRAQAYYDPKTKTVFLIADHIRAGDEAAVLIHELMHKHGQAVLGKEGWDKLHSVIGTWANADIESEERQIYNYAAAKVRAVGEKLSNQELFPYAVEAAMKAGIKPNAMAAKGSVEKWLANVIQSLKTVWAKVTGKPDTFKVQDLVDLAFGIAQMENPDLQAVGDFRDTNEAVTKSNDVVGNQSGRSADDISPGVQSRMVAAYNEELKRDGNDVPPGYWYREVTQRDVENTYGDIEDVPANIREALTRGEDVVEWGSNSDGGLWTKSEAPTEQEFYDDARRDEGWPGPIKTIDQIFGTPNLNEAAASRAFEVLAESEGWSVGNGVRYLEISRPNTDKAAIEEGYDTVRVNVRISNHSRTANASRPTNAKNIDINLAPQFGNGNEFHHADTWESAVEKMRSAKVGKDGDLKFSNESTAPDSDGATMFSRNDQTQTANFKRWFGNSAVVDADGKPLVVYHETSNMFGGIKDGVISVFKTPSFFSPSPETYFEFHKVKPEGYQKYPVYLSLQNPKITTDFTLASRGVYENDPALAGHDGVILKDENGNIIHVVAFRPEQIKSAIGNNGQFDPANADIRYSMADTLTSAANSVRDVNLAAGYKVSDLINSVPGKLSWWHKTVGTQYNLAQRSKPFKRVYDAVQNFMNDVSFYATEAADLAPTIIPKLEDWKDIAKKPVSAEDTKAYSKPVFEGTLVWARDESGKLVKAEDLDAAAAKLTPQQKAQRLLRGDYISESELKALQALPIAQYETAVNDRYDRDVLQAGVVFSDEELKSQFTLNNQQIQLYREFRAATDTSLKNLAVADMLRYGGDDVAPIRDTVLESKTVTEAADTLRDYLLSMAAADPARSDVLTDTANKMIEKGDKAQSLMDRGYAPLSRFGKYTLDVVDKDGNRVYFGMFEAAAEAAKMRRKMEGLYPGAVVNQGTVSEQAYKLFAGVSPETLELFGDMLGLESQGDKASAQAFQEYLKLAKSSRSAMKRLIQRKGIAGFSEDAGRVLAGFVYSNARQTATSLNMGEMAKSAADKEAFGNQGDLQDAAVKLVDYIKNPQEEAQALRGLMFAQYIGGSVASAMVNMTQPITMTFPWLSQYGGAGKAAKQMTAAMKDSQKRFTGDAKLDAALRRAEEDGTVSPQEVHQLMKQSQGQGALRSGDGTRAGDAMAKTHNALSKIGLVWGKLFSVAEQFNRRVTFIAAYRTAVDQGMKDPDAFARQAIAETQGVYNKGNKPAWARGAVGSTLFTFKQYSIAYMEMLSRMAKNGPEGKKAALLALGVLFLMSGAGGMPGADDLDDVISGTMQALGYNFDSKAKRKEFFVSLLGEGGAEFMERGVSGLPGAPIDVSGRMGLGNLVPGTGLFTKKTDHTRDVAEFAGPAGDFVRRAFDSASKAITGDAVGGAKSLAPKAISNLVQAFDMSNMGMYRDQKGNKVIDTDGYDAISKAIGFQPNAVKRVQDASSEVNRMVGLNKITESDIANRWAQGIFEKDPAKIQAARDDLSEWNRDNPESPIRINFRQIASRVHQMNMTKAERVAKTAPKEIRAAVRQELANAR